MFFPFMTINLEKCNFSNSFFFQVTHMKFKKKATLCNNHFKSLYVISIWKFQTGFNKILRTQTHLHQHINDFIIMCIENDNLLISYANIFC